MATDPYAGATRNSDGSIQNPAAWGITPSQGITPGTYNPSSAPAVDWNAVRDSGFGGLYNGMAGSELDQILANSQRNFERGGQVDSNLSSYLNNRDTARGFGILGNDKELDMNSLFAGVNPVQNLEFGPDKAGVSFQNTNNTTNQNLARVMQAMGGGGYANLGQYMDGFSGTPEYGVFGQGLSSNALAQTLLRNGLNRGMGDIGAMLSQSGTREVNVPVSNRYDQQNFQYAGGASRPPTPTAPSTPSAGTPPGVPQAPSVPGDVNSALGPPPSWNPSNPEQSTRDLISYMQRAQQYAARGQGGSSASQGGGGQQQIDNGPQMVQTPQSNLPPWMGGGQQTGGNNTYQPPSWNTQTQPAQNNPYDTGMHGGGNTQSINNTNTSTPPAQNTAASYSRQPMNWMWGRNNTNA